MQNILTTQNNAKGQQNAAIFDVSRKSKNAPLGKLTKFQATPENKGFQRTNKFILQDQSAKLLPKERVCNCLKKRIDKNKNRFVLFNENREKALWGNLQRCGSIWSCPVCATQIT